MDTLLTILRWAIIVIPALFLLNKYVRKLYGFSLFQHLAWLAKPSERQPIDVGVPVFSVILFVICIFFASYITDGIYMKAIGKTQEYVYLGNSTAFNARFYQQGDDSDKVIVNFSPNLQYNFSFDDIERKQLFIKNPDDNSGLGDTVSQYSAGRIFGFIFTILIFLLPMLGTLHASFSPMCAQKLSETNPNNFYRYDWNVSFDQQLRQHHFSLSLWALTWILSIILMIYSQGAFPRQQFGERVTPLPYQITPGNIIEGVPLSIEVIESKTTSNSSTGSTRYDYYETTQRNVIFTFENIFSQTVFVTTNIDINEKPELEELINDNIQKGTKIPVVITDNLGFEPIHNQDI